MEIAELVSGLKGVPSDSTDPAIDWNERGRLWSELAARTEALLVPIVPEAFCTAQEWDNRIDCQVKLPNGSIEGEMIGLEELTTERLRKTAERLQRRCAGEHVQLVNEIRRPTYIGGPLPKDR